MLFSRTVKDDFGRALRTRGELSKKGGSRSSLVGRRNWQMRFFSLDLDRGELRYFENSTMSCQKGLVQLTPCSQVKEDGLSLELKACLDDKGAARDTFCVKAKSPQEVEEWVTSLRFSLKIVREMHDQVSIDDLQQENNRPSAALVVAELADKLKKDRSSSVDSLKKPSPPPRFIPPPPPPRRQQTV